MTDLTMLAQMSPLFGLAGLAELGAGMEILFGYVLFLLMASTVVVGLTLRSRLVVLASLVLAVLMGLIAADCCFDQVNSPDPDVRYWSEAYRKERRVWAGGVVVSVPVVIAAAVRAFRKKVSARRELAAVSIVLAVLVFAVIVLHPAFLLPAVVAVPLVSLVLLLISRWLPD